MKIARLLLVTLGAVVSIVFATAAHGQPVHGQHTVKVPASHSTAFTFALPDSVVAPRQLRPRPARGISGTLEDSAPRCQRVHNHCPTGAYDVITLSGRGPLAALHDDDRRLQQHPLAHGTDADGLVWQRYRSGSLLLVAPVSCARLGSAAPSACGSHPAATRYVVLELLGSTPTTLLTPSVDRDVTASAQFSDASSR